MTAREKLVALIATAVADELERRGFKQVDLKFTANVATPSGEGQQATQSRYPHEVGG